MGGVRDSEKGARTEYEAGWKKFERCELTAARLNGMT